MIMKPLTQRAQSGDLFYIPAINKVGAYGFVMARYIELIQPNSGYLIEVFANFYEVPPKSFDEVDKSQRLFRPIMFDMYFKIVPKWKILFNDPSYDKSQSDYENITIAFYKDLWIGGNSKIKPANPGQLKEFEDSTCWRTHHIIFRVNVHLAGVFGPNDSYDYHRVPKGERVDDPEAQAKVIALANEMDNRFKVWAEKAKAKKPRTPKV